MGHYLLDTQYWVKSQIIKVRFTQLRKIIDKDFFFSFGSYLLDKVDRQRSVAPIELSLAEEIELEGKMAGSQPLCPFKYLLKMLSDEIWNLFVSFLGPDSWTVATRRGT